jgi:hypothetical protein
MSVPPGGEPLRFDIVCIMDYIPLCIRWSLVVWYEKLQGYEETTTRGEVTLEFNSGLTWALMRLKDGLHTRC